jgi:predicted RNA binding protein YcfA (HicA-like mRNA interferase family)
MPPIPTISGKNLFKILIENGFIIYRVRGSHHRLKHPDGRVTTIPVHKNQDIPKGLLRKIIREDLQMDVQQFIDMMR